VDATQLCSLPATDLSRLVRTGEVSPVEVVDAALERIDHLDPHLHAFVELTADRARQRAREIADALARGEDVGPLAGVPVAVKDLIATAGIPTRSGSPAYRDFVPDEDDVVVERIIAAGAVVLGKTTVPEFGYSAVGHNPISPTARNPWNPALTPGGSSAGSGIAVATGMSPVALGSDGGGSVRIPAAHCGIYGFKASMGRVPLYPGCRDERYPGMSGWESLECIGPMTRTVDDAALMMSVLAGPDPRDRHSIPAGDVDWSTAAGGDVRGMRIAFSADLGYITVDPQVRAVVTDAVEAFRELGCSVEEVDPGWPDPHDTFWRLVVADTDLTGMRELAARYGNEMSPHLLDMLSRTWTAEQLTDAVMARKAVVNRMWRLMADYDLLVTPTLTVPPFAVGMQGPEEVDGRIVASSSAWLGFTQPINMTGQPAASCPAGMTADGLPVGLHIVGRHLDDAAVLRASAAFERARPWATRWPGMVEELMDTSTAVGAGVTP
jgi:aspartyl-tRNA(Asn)/glutamyl-tRNA(Gln) amidotransferase subunit A